MWDRYTSAFVSEMRAFAKAVSENLESPVTGDDGLYPVLMARPRQVPERKPSRQHLRGQLTRTKTPEAGAPNPELSGVFC